MGRRRRAGGRLSLKVRGESSQCLHQGDAKREEYLKVRTPIDFFSSFFAKKGKKKRGECDLEDEIHETGAKN